MLRGSYAKSACDGQVLEVVAFNGSAELAEWTERASQLVSTYADYEEYEYDGLQLCSDGSDPRWSEHDNLKNESY